MRLNWLTAGLVASVALLSNGCSATPADGPGAASSTSEPPATAPSATNAATTPPAPPTTTATPTSWAMPNLVGQNLQAAQDAVQTLTGDAIFFSSSTDATGQGRAQVLDSNWKVCSQNIPPGDMVTTATKIEFAAVKLDERCP